MDSDGRYEPSQHALLLRPKNIGPLFNAAHACLPSVVINLQGRVKGPQSRRYAGHGQLRSCRQANWTDEPRLAALGTLSSRGIHPQHPPAPFHPRRLAIPPLARARFTNTPELTTHPLLAHSAKHAITQPSPLTRLRAFIPRVPAPPKPTHSLPQARAARAEVLPPWPLLLPCTRSRPRPTPKWWLDCQSPAAPL